MSRTSLSSVSTRPVQARRLLVAAPAAAVLLAGGAVIAGDTGDTGSGSAFGGLGVPTASAHDAMVGATPAEGASLDEAPDSIELEFSGEPREGFNTVTLSRDGEVLVNSDPQLDGHMVTLDIPDDVSVDDGDYTVAFRVTSSDGHVVEGSYDFTVGDGGAAGDTGDSEDVEDNGASDDGLPSWAGPLLGIAGVIVVLGALIALVARFRSMSGDE